MGKKKGNKKNKKQKHYNKKQFIDIFCTNCNLCLHDPVNPFFCYEESYRLNSKGFSTSCYKNLLAAGSWLSERGDTAVSMDVGRFEAIFCDSMCESYNCELLSSCYETFQDQIKGNGPQEKERKNEKKGRKNKKKKRYVFKPYPTIFTSDSEDWKNKIEEILADGDNNRQQDKTEEGSSRAE